MKARARAESAERADRMVKQDLDQEILESINRLPAGARTKLLSWMDTVIERLEEGPTRQATNPADAAALAVDVAVTRERSRISRELHDGLASDLATAVSLFRYYFESSRKEEDGEQVLRNVLEILEMVLENTRSTLRAMRPRRLGPGGLIEELRQTAEEYGRVYGIRVEIWTNGREEELTPGQREVVFHIIREALTNVRRHSGTTVCRVRLALAARPFMVEVSDEGKGFENTAASGYGLVGMRERAAGIGGRLEVVTTPGRGTTVFLFGPAESGTY